MAKKPQFVKTLQEVANHFGVKYLTVKTNWRNNGMPGTKGAWDLAAIAEWKALRGRDPDGPPASGGVEEDEELKALRRRKLELETEIRELEKIKRTRLERVASGDVVSRVEVEAEVSQACIRLRRNLGALPRLMITHFPRDCAMSLSEELRRLIDNTLNTTAQEFKACIKANKPLDDGILPDPDTIPSPRRKSDGKEKQVKKRSTEKAATAASAQPGCL